MVLLSGLMLLLSIWVVGLSEFWGIRKGAKLPKTMVQGVEVDSDYNYRVPINAPFFFFFNLSGEMHTMFSLKVCLVSLLIRSNGQ